MVLTRFVIPELSAKYTLAIRGTNGSKNVPEGVVSGCGAT